MKKLDLDVLEMVVAVAETGSFVGGAESVHRSPSAVSMQIKALEDALGKPLFERSTRSLAITAEGRRWWTTAGACWPCGRKPGRRSCARR